MRIWQKINEYQLDSKFIQKQFRIMSKMVYIFIFFLILDTAVLCIALVKYVNIVVILNDPYYFLNDYIFTDGFLPLTMIYYCLFLTTLFYVRFMYRKKL